jgi:hypothetical protein
MESFFNLAEDLQRVLFLAKYRCAYSAFLRNT